MANPNTNSLLTDSEEGCIAGGLPLKAMRIAMENKGIFNDAKPGALYYFTGEYNTVTIDDVTSYKIPKTAKIEGPDSIQNGINTYKIQLTVNDGKISGAKLIPG